MKSLVPFLVAGAATFGVLALPVQDVRGAQDAATAQEDRDYTDRLSKLAWMAGHWRGRGRQFLQEEVWVASRGNLMLGVHRDHDLGKDTSNFEFMRIELVGSSIVLKASPSGRTATPFTLVHAGEKQVVFENAEHDFPQRITYRRTEDVLTAEIGLLVGDPAATFTWTLVE